MNELSQSASETAGKIQNARSHKPLMKLQSYLGLFVVVGVAFVLFSPRAGSGVFDVNPRRYIMNESYHHKTVLSDLVVSAYRGEAFDVISAGDFVRGCEQTKRSVSVDHRDLSSASLFKGMERLSRDERKNVLQSFLDACSPRVLAMSRGTIERIKIVEPQFFALNEKLNSLTDDARASQAGTPHHQPVPTEEMVSIAERLLKVQMPLFQESADRLLWANGVAHLMAVTFVFLGVWLRKSVGRALTAPFGWMFWGAKKVHENV